MPLSARQKAALAITLLVLGGLVFAFLKICLPLLNEVRATAYQVDGFKVKLDKMQADFHNYPVPQQYIDELEPVVAGWKDSLDRRARLFTTTLETIPASVKTPEFHFDGQLQETQRRLQDKSRRTGIFIPPDLGLGAGIPLPDQVETLLNQMSNGEYVLDLAMDSGVTAVSNLTIDYPTAQNGFINIMPLRISFNASMDALKKFLLACSNGPQYLNVKSIALRPGRDAFGATKFDVDLVLTTTWLSMEKAAVKDAEVTATTGLGRRPMGRFRGMRGPRGRGPAGAPTASPADGAPSPGTATGQSPTPAGQ